MHLPRLAMLVVAASLVECSSPDAPALCDVSHPTPLLLSVGGAPTSVNVCAVTFPANASTDSAEYLVVPQSASGNPGASAPYELRASGVLTTSVVSPSVVSPSISAAHVSRSGGELAARFDRQLRELARRPAPLPPGERLIPRPAASAVAQVVTPPKVGDIRKFPHVCTNLGCTTWDTVNAVVKAVSGHVAIYVDPARPGDLSQADIDSLAGIFDQHVYVVDTTTFGREPDIDNNGVVIALLSGTVNALSSPATCFTTGYVAGFFFSPDLDIQVAANYNNGEIMYGLVADTAGVYSCRHPIATVKRLLPPTFLHELEHMISYTQHVRVRRPAPAEDIWLDEALAHYAEELGARSYLPGGTAADTAKFYQYVLDDLNNSYQYLRTPGSYYLVAPSDQDLSSNGAGWLFVRYLIDQIGDSLARRLVNTAMTGTSNISTQSGIPFETLVQGWALALWVSDLPGFTPPPQLRFTSWQFRQAFPALQARDTTGRYPLAFPFVPLVMGGPQVNLAGTLHAGSGDYLRVVQPPAGGSFTLTFTGPASAPLPTAIKARLVVLRLR